MRERAAGRDEGARAGEGVEGKRAVGGTISSEINVVQRIAAVEHGV